MSVLVIIIVFLTTGRIVVGKYRPLEAGSVTRFPSASLSIRPEPPYRDEAYVLPYRHGHEADVSFSVRNSGRFRVTILDVPLIHTDFGGLLVFSGAMLGDPFDRQARLKPFRPFSLAPGHEALITLRGILFNCDSNSPGVEESFDRFRVQYRFLWITHTAEIGLPAPLKVISPPDADCPPPRFGPQTHRAPTVPPLPSIMPSG